MEEVADAMGHVDTRMTSRVYRHNLKSVVDVAAVHFGAAPLGIETLPAL